MATLELADRTMYTRNLNEFQDAANSFFVPLRVSASRPGSFHGSMSAHRAGPVVFTEVSASSSTVERTSQMVSEGGCGYYKLSLLLSGTGLLVQNGREAVMQPGDLVMYDTSLPYTLVFDGEFCNLIVMLAKDQLEFPASWIQSMTVTPLGAIHPLVGVFANTVTGASAQISRLGVEARQHLGQGTVGMAQAVFSAVLGQDRPVEQGRNRTLDEITQFIEDNLHLPELNPRMIAAAHFISLRRLHSLFEDTGQTVSGLIRHRRLERCWAELANPESPGIRVADIARRWGFRDPANFSRIFRQKYGLAPREIKDI